MSELWDLLLACCACGLRFQVTDDGDLAIDAPKAPAPELLASLRAHKAELVAMLTPPIESEVEIEVESEVDSGLDPFENAIEPPPPCPSCGTWELWQSLLGDWRCLRCDPPLDAPRWRENAQRLKKRSHRIAPDARSATASTQVSTNEGGPENANATFAPPIDDDKIASPSER